MNKPQVKRFDYKLLLKLSGLLILILVLYRLDVAFNDRAPSVSSVDWCSKAQTSLDGITTGFHVHAFRRAYENAAAALSMANKCDNDTLRLPMRGLILGEKALSEHYLPGHDVDADIDLNQAVTLLTECETDPNLYGTQGGAECQTFAETLEKAKTEWEMQDALPSHAP